MIEFHPEKPIYLQIIDFAYGQILTGAWEPGARIPSVRELAVLMNVNTHTILKAYESLQAGGILEVRRGMGYYLGEDAREKVNIERRRQFLEQETPAFLSRMRMLGLTLDDVVRADREQK